MSDEQTGRVEWDGNALIGWVTINGVPTRVTADRETIHRHAAGFDDALDWEIKRHAIEILEKMKAFFHAGYAERGGHLD